VKFRWVETHQSITVFHFEMIIFLELHGLSPTVSGDDLIVRLHPTQMLTANCYQRRVSENTVIPVDYCFSLPLFLAE